jgi:formylglycine-generating enzyme required for sulfatase activity
LGDYELLEVLSESEDIVEYRALQCSVQREVALERLRTGPASNPEAIAAFSALVRAKAAVVHPQIAAVYEAQEQDGRIFYTRELVRGRNLHESLAAGRRFDQEEALRLLATAAEAVRCFEQLEIARGPITPSELILGSDGLPRVANVALATPPESLDQRAEILLLAESIEQGLDPDHPAPEFEHLLSRLRDGSARGLRSWKSFAATLEEARRRVEEAAADAEGGGVRGSPARTAALRRRVLVFGSLAALMIISFVVARFLPYWTAPRARAFDTMVHVPAGPFLYQNGETRTLPDFWIDAHEVTIAQYAEFLDHLARFPGVSYAHERQPESEADHVPAGWNELHDAARRGGTYGGMLVDLNCPVTGVSFWDAWAYARWKERRLPTEFEWEKAARGSEGRLFPWGNKPDPAKANTGADYAERMTSTTVDGFAGWAPVDAFENTDVSSFGMVGCAGNVSEWTDSLMLDPNVLDKQVPVLRGGNYHLKPADLLLRRPAPAYGHADLTTGFRTASDRAP